MFSGVGFDRVQLGCHISAVGHYGATPWSRPSAHVCVISTCVYTENEHWVVFHIPENGEISFHILELKQYGAFGADLKKYFFIKQ